MLILLKQTGGTSTKTRLFWNTVTKATESDTITSVLTYTRGGGTLTGLQLFIDAYEVGADVVAVVWRNDYTTPIFETYSESKLLSFLNTSDNLSKVITFFQVGSKITQVLERPHGDGAITIYKAFDNTYTRNLTDTLATQCVGVNQVSWLSDGTGGVSKSVNYNSVSCGFVVATPGTVVTESIVIKLDNECKDNPIYLRWLNTLGGYDYFMFNYTNEKLLETKSRGVFEKTYTSLSEKTLSYSRGKKANRSIIVGADLLSRNEYEGIYPDLLTSASVVMINAQGVETPVNIIEGSWSLIARDNAHSVEFELELPQYFTVTQ